MAVHQSPRANNQEREHNFPTSNAAVTTTAMPTTSPPSGRKSIAMGADPEDMLLLREKLNQIAVGRRHVGDNQIDHMDDSGEDDDVNGRSAARRRRTAPGNGHFRMFLPVGDRPSTPPSSPQPRDVLRRHLRLKSHVPPLYTTQRSTGSDDYNSDTTTDDLLDVMCVDGIEISPLPDGSHRIMPSHPTVRLSVPEHLRVRPSSYNMHTKCPEGLRKRKSVYMDDKDLLIDGQSVVAPLKKVSSQVNILSSSTSVTSSTSPVADVSCDQEMEDVGSDPSDSPTDGSPCS